MRKHVTKPDNPLSVDTQHLEMKAMLQICLHALAHSLGRGYPTLITTARSLARKWRHESSPGKLRGQASRLVCKFLDIGYPLDADADIQRFAAKCLRHLKATNHHALRAYVSLTEAFNCAVTSTVLTRREWLCPWSKWSGYVYRPLWEHEEDFILVTAALGGMDADVVGADLTGVAPACVSETVSRIAATASRVQLPSPAQSKTTTARWLKITASRVRKNYLINEWQSKLVAALQWYLSSGQLLLCRRWWGGYKLALTKCP